MLNRILTIARKEVADSLRDRRSLAASLVYSLMGPCVVFLIALAMAGSAKPQDSGPPLTGMMCVFTLVAAFVGGMNVAMDVLAGERERKSLLPLLMNPLSRREVILGKWLAIGLFSTAGLILNLAGFLAVFASTALAFPGSALLWLWIAGATLVPLAWFASALELSISTICRTTREAHTYLSLLVFLPMGVGMLLVFFPRAAQGFQLLPVFGQQRELMLMMSGAGVPLAEPLAVGLLTVACTACILLASARRLEEDDVVYGN